MAEDGIRKRAARGTAALVEFITRRIEDGTWSPGHKLPTERELEDEFGLARNTLRRSLKLLESEGRITRHVGRGTFVAHPVSSVQPSGGLERRIQQASPAEIMDVRLVIEPQAVEFAATRATGDDIQFLLQCLQHSEAAESTSEFEHWDGALHARIIAAAGNGLLSEIYQAINAVRNTDTWGKLKERSLTPERQRLYERHHRAMVEALERRDADLARYTMRDHLLAVRAGLMEV